MTAANAEKHYGLQPDMTRWVFIQNDQTPVEIFESMGALDSHRFNDVSARPGDDPSYMVRMGFADLWYFATCQDGPHFGRVAYIRTDLPGIEARSGWNAAEQFMRNRLQCRITKLRSILGALETLHEALGRK
jgi:hypothetical protein